MPSGASAWCAVTDGSAVAARTQLLSLLAGCTSSVEAVLRLVPRTTMDSRCVASRTGIAWAVTRDARRFLRVQVSLLCSGCSRDDVMHTRWAFDDCIKEFGPENFSTLQRCVKDEIRAPSMQVSAVFGRLKVHKHAPRQHRLSRDRVHRPSWRCFAWVAATRMCTTSSSRCCWTKPCTARRPRMFCQT